ncbi:MAG: hypothetical protein DPW16_14065 [Chloroflexi bacterium]|nr:hypothetical protein [Chloroflexota bacterium]
MTKLLLVEVIGTLMLSMDFLPSPVVVGLQATGGPIYLGSKLEYSRMPEGSQNLIIRNGSVTRMHAIISQENDDWFVEDCGSDNGLIILDCGPNPIARQARQRVSPFQKHPITKTSLLILGDVVVRVSI